MFLSFFVSSSFYHLWSLQDFFYFNFFRLKSTFSLRNYFLNFPFFQFLFLLFFFWFPQFFHEIISYVQHILNSYFLSNWNFLSFCFFSIYSKSFKLPSSNTIEVFFCYLSRLFYIYVFNISSNFISTCFEAFPCFSVSSLLISSISVEMIFTSCNAFVFFEYTFLILIILHVSGFFQGLVANFRK